MDIISFIKYKKCVKAIEDDVSHSLSRITSLTETGLTCGNVVEAVGIPVFVDDVSEYSAYGILETGWYTFARINAKDGVTVSAQTTVTGADGYIATNGADHVDVAVRFGVAAQSKEVVVNWGSNNTDSFIFRATDLAVRNLDYRSTFYVYDIAEFAAWTWAFTTDATFAADKNYFTLADNTYTQAEVTASDPIPAYFTLDERTYTQVTGLFEDGVTYYTKSGDTYTQAEVTVGDPIPAYFTLEDETYTQATGVFEDGVTYYTKSGDTYTEAEVIVGDPIPAYFTQDSETYTQAAGSFENGVTYYTKSGSVYSEAVVTVGDPIPAYYDHTKLTFSGMIRNVTYRFNEMVDCPIEIVLPEVPNDGYGAWFEIQMQYSKSVSITLTPTDNTVVIGTATTQAQTAGINVVDLQYSDVNGIKMWTLLNTHSNLPAAGGS